MNGFQMEDDQNVIVEHPKVEMFVDMNYDLFKELD